MSKAEYQKAVEQGVYPDEAPDARMAMSQKIDELNEQIDQQVELIAEAKKACEAALLQIEVTMKTIDEQIARCQRAFKYAFEVLNDGPRTCRKCDGVGKRNVLNENLCWDEVQCVDCGGKGVL